jgi:hypothetical protein
MPLPGDEPASWIVFPVLFPILFPILFPMLFMMSRMMASRSGPFGMMSLRARSAPGPGGASDVAPRGGSSSRDNPAQSDDRVEPPLETARRRYASGEISREEFQRIREDLKAP